MKKLILHISVCLAVLCVLLLSGCEGIKHTHTYGEWTTIIEPTCTEEGLMERTCTKCNNTEQWDMEVIPHTYTSRTVVPSCEEQGYTLNTCSCGYSYKSNFVPQNAHNFTSEIIPPTCNASGYTHLKCKECDFSTDSDFTSPTGHELVSTLNAPTCENSGYTYNKCKSCEYETYTDFTAPTGHDLDSKLREPTCTDGGHTHYDCKSCDFEYDSDFTAPTGHTYEKTVKRATATVGGYTRYECDCGYYYIGDRVYYSDILESAYVQNTEILARGIDVSRWNHEVNADGSFKPLDFEAIKAAGFEFVIIKLGSTRTGIEPTFLMDYEGAKAAGLDVGAYFYTYSTTVDGALEDARATLEIIKGKSFEYPIYFDMEEESAMTLGKNLLTDMCFAYIETLQENGYYAALYTNNEWMNLVLDMPRIVSVLDIWYARYPKTSDDEVSWDEDKYGRQLGMWQYTDRGEIEGFDTVFDFNYVYKDYPTLMKTWGLNGF